MPTTRETPRCAWHSRDCRVDQRAALVLHLYAGYTVEQTARIVDAPVETVRARLRRGKDRLRTLLGDGR